MLIDQRTDESRKLIVVLDDDGRNLHKETRSFMCEHELTAKTLCSWLRDNGRTSIVVDVVRWNSLPNYQFGER